MARKKKAEDPPQGAPAWMATFSDLMNLLLCFFVLLFSMSSVDESKAEALMKSLASTFSIFSGGGSSFDDGVLISSGATQLSMLDDYFTTVGQTSEGDNTENPNESENGGEQEDNPDPGVSPVPTKTPSGEDLEQTYEEWNKGENKEQTGLIYDEIVGLADRYNLGDFLEIGVDGENYEYVRIELKGSVLFDSGKAEIKEDAMPILSRLGDVLKQYRNYRLEVIGHTDNVPQYSAEFKDNDMLSAGRALKVATYLVDKKNLSWEHVYFSGRGEHEPVADNDTTEGRAKNRRVEIRLYNQRNSE